MRKNQIMTFIASNTFLYLFFSFANLRWVTIDMISGWDSVERGIFASIWLIVVAISAVVCLAVSEK